MALASLKNPAIRAFFSSDRPVRLTAILTAGGVCLSLVVAAVVSSLVPWVNPRIFLSASGLMPAFLLPVVLYPVVRANQRLRQMREEMGVQARTDPLTLLPNRRHFFERAAVAGDQLGARTSIGHALMMIDVDAFKEVNDSFGHRAGDEMVRAVARAISDAVADGRPAHWVVARIGGDEFAVLVEDMDRYGVMHLASTIRDRVRDTVIAVDGNMLSRTVSIGATSWRRGEAIDTALSRADRGVYAVKRGGRNGWLFVDEDREAASQAGGGAAAFPVALQQTSL